MLKISQDWWKTWICRSKSSMNSKQDKLKKPKHIIITMVKAKGKMLKAARRKQLNSYTGSLIRLTANFISETMETWRQWGSIVKVLKEKDSQTRILHPAKLPFKHQGKIKSFLFLGKQKKNFFL